MINWWKKGFFDDLKPFDTLTFEEILGRYQGVLKTFANYKDQAEKGFFFLGIKSTDLSDPDVKYYHEKFNHPSCDITKKPWNKICLVEQHARNFSKPEFHREDGIKFSGNTSNYNGRDGQIRGGWATPTVEELHINPVREGRFTGEWIYLHIPHQLIYNFLNKTNNGAPFQIAKKFVKEIESTIGWDNIEEVRKVVDRYDEDYPDWNHDFPINGYFQMKNDGLLFPAVWPNPDILCGHSYHRMIMTSFNKIDFPFIMPVPAKSPDVWYAASKLPTFLFNNQEQYLTAKIDRINKEVTYSFTTDPRWAKEKKLI